MDDTTIHQCECPACLSGADHPERHVHEQINLLFQRLDEQQRRWVAAIPLRSAIAVTRWQRILQPVFSSDTAARPEGSGEKPEGHIAKSKKK
jgi:hypothetical protein